LLLTNLQEYAQSANKGGKGPVWVFGWILRKPAL